MVEKSPSRVKIYAGDTFSLQFRLRDSLTNQLLDLSSYTNWRADLRQTLYEDVEVSFMVAYTALTSIVTISMTKEQTRAIDPGPAVLDVQATASDGSVRTFFWADVVIEQDVKR